MPTFPENALDITHEQAINMLLGSIAMEEMALSHIMNAEGEKLQYFLGTLPNSGYCCATPKEILEVNKSISDLLENVMHNQLLLKGKLKQVLEAKKLWNNDNGCDCKSNDCCNDKAFLHAESNSCWFKGSSLKWPYIKCDGLNIYVNTTNQSEICFESVGEYHIEYFFSVEPITPGFVSISCRKFQNREHTDFFIARGIKSHPNTPVKISGSALLQIEQNKCDLKCPSISFTLREPQNVRIVDAYISISHLP